MSKQWLGLNEQIGGNPDFYPLTIKAAYFIGIIHDICESVSILLENSKNKKSVTYLPACGVFSSAIELFGRCITGNSNLKGSSYDLMNGFKWLVSSEYKNVEDDTVLITTSKAQYSLKSLAAIRHFAAHGQAVSKNMIALIDYEILENMPSLLSDGLERYWHELLNDENTCNNLAKANLLAYRNWPVLNLWKLLQGEGPGQNQTLTTIFKRFNWNIC